jgi:2-aminoethylphosphonate-pyruvate transaminase
VLILSPGPANISERVRGMLAMPDIGHRDVEFRRLLQDCRDLLLTVCGAPDGYSSVILNGSGTASIEAVITALRGGVNGALIVANGVYGDRAAEIAKIYGVPYQKLDFGWTRPLDLDKVEARVRETSHGAVYVVHHETTTGILNPLQELGAIAKRHDKWLLVDAVSSVGGEALDLASWGVDLIIGSANKCIRGVPGASFVVLSDALVDALREREQVAYYNDLMSHVDKEGSGETPFTPPVQVLYAFREALLELSEEGVSSRISHYRQIAGTLRDRLADLGLELLLPRELYSNTMTSVLLPSGQSFDDLHDRLREMDYLIYKGQGYLADRVFRLGTVGVMSMTDILGFSEALGEVLRQPASASSSRAQAGR